MEKLTVNPSSPPILTSKTNFKLPTYFVIGLLIMATSVTVGINIGKRLRPISQVTSPLPTIEPTRMNGVLVLDEVKDITLNNSAVTIIPENLIFSNFNDITFDEITLDYKNVIHKYTTKIDKHIDVSIEVIKDERPFLATTRSSEWLGVISIEPYVHHLTNNTEPDPEIYNTEINGIPFSSSYAYYKPGGSVSLNYITAQHDPNQGNIILYTLSTWTNVLDLSDEDFSQATQKPEQWFTSNPSKEFINLEAYLKENLKF